MNIFGKKTELEQKIESFRQLATVEHEMADTFVEAIREWAKLEADYARELMGLKTRLDKMPRKVQ